MKGGKNKPQSKKRRKAHLKRFINHRRAKYNVKNYIGNDLRLSKSVKYKFGHFVRGRKIENIIFLLKQPFNFIIRRTYLALLTAFSKLLKSSIFRKRVILSFTSGGAFSSSGTD